MQPSNTDTHFKEVSADEWHALVSNISPFFTAEWEAVLMRAFPYLRFRYFLYRDAFAVRLAHIGGRLTTVPFSDGGDVIALAERSVPLSLREFRTDCIARFGSRITLRVHGYFCPVTDTEAFAGDIIDFRVDLTSFDAGLLRKTLRHIVGGGVPEGSLIRAAQQSDAPAIYHLYLTTMRAACALALPYDVFTQHLLREAFVFVSDGVIHGASIFLLNERLADYFISATDEAGKRENAAHHLLLHAITHFAAQGKDALFLGGTSTDSSLRVFKEGWRGEPYTLYTIAARSTHESARRTPLRALWKLVPLFLLPKASELAGKYLL